MVDQIIFKNMKRERLHLFKEGKEPDLSTVADFKKLQEISPNAAVFKNQ